MSWAQNVINGLDWSNKKVCLRYYERTNSTVFKNYKRLIQINRNYHQNAYYESRFFSERQKP